MVMRVGGRKYIPSIGSITGGDSMTPSMSDFGASGLPPVPNAGVDPLAHYGQNTVQPIQPTIPNYFPPVQAQDQPVQLSQPQQQPLQQIPTTQPNINYTAPNVGLSGNWLTRMQANHPILSGIGESLLGGLTGTTAAMQAYNLYQGLHGNGALGALGNSLSSLFSGDGGGSVNDPAIGQSLGDLASMGGRGSPGQMSGGGYAGPPGGGQTQPGGQSGGGYAGVPGAQNFSSQQFTPGPVGGYWNQRALADAHPVYGPNAMQPGLAALGNH